MRPIDGEKLLHILNEMDQTWEYGRAVSDIYDIVKEMPTLTPPNEPLTIEQLREMAEEPVFMVFDSVNPISMWALVDVHKGKRYNEVILTISNGSKFSFLCQKSFEEQGVLVYRRPPEGEEDT